MTPQNQNLQKEIGFPNQELEIGQIGKSILTRSLSNDKSLLTSKSLNQYIKEIENLQSLWKEPKTKIPSPFEIDEMEKQFNLFEISSSEKPLPKTEKPLKKVFKLKSKKPIAPVAKPITFIGKKPTIMEAFSLDKYYTHPELAEACVSKFKDFIYVGTRDIVIEPTAGNGAFSDLFAKSEIIAYDIFPEKEGIIQKDFFSLELDKEFPGANNLHFIGNPPFGNNADKVIPIVLQILNSNSAKSISFILPTFIAIAFLQEGVGRVSKGVDLAGKRIFHYKTRKKK